MADYYEILTLPPHANLADIKARYRQLSLRYHPDRGGSTEKMMQLNAAYRILSNPLLRREYDQKYTSNTTSSTRATYATSYAHTPYTHSAPTYASQEPSEPMRRQTTQTPPPRTFTRTEPKSHFWSWFSLFVFMALGFVGYEIYMTMEPSTASVSTTTNSTTQQATADQPTVTTAQTTPTATDSSYASTTPTRYHRRYYYTEQSADETTPVAASAQAAAQY